MKRWWDADSNEQFWLEITDREDLGVDLNAPQLKDDGVAFWGYSLIQEVRDGEMVFHFHKPHGGIVAWSRAAGEYWEDEVVWGARGTAARTSGITPYKRPGWRLGLESFASLPKLLTLQEIRQHEDIVREIHDGLVASHGDPLYFPFALSDKRPLRTQQGYLTKLPVDLVRYFPVLNEAAEVARETAPSSPVPARTVPGSSSDLGMPSEKANEEAAVSERDPFTVDPTLVERGLRGHAVTQNLLRAHLVSKGLLPRRPKPGEPEYDLAWRDGDRVFVAEVKSTTDSNQEKQLRLGLGQVLRYRHLLASGGAEVTAVLAIEKSPADPSWVELCEAQGVLLVWPEVLKERLG